MDSYSRAELEVEGNEAAEIGIAFHAAMHMAAESFKSKKPERSMLGAIEATALALSNRMDPLRARAGADMAINFLEAGWQFDDRLNYEHGLAFTKDWRGTGWDDADVRLRMVADVYGKIEEEDDSGKFFVALSEDYKTGWGAAANILDSIQLKCHSSALWALHGKDCAYIEIRVNATRFRKVFSKRWSLDNPDDVEDLKKRQKDVEFFMNAADASDLKPRIGSGCILCDFSAKCPAFQERLAAIKSGDVVNIASDPIAAARDFAIITSEHKRLQAGLKEATKAGTIELGDKVLGFHISQARRLKDPTLLVEYWYSKANGSMNSAEDAKRTARGLIKALGPGITQLDNMIKVIARAVGYKSQKAAIEALSPDFADTEERATFKWAKKEQLDGQPDSDE